jgi:hypothetical protein
MGDQEKPMLVNFKFPEPPKEVATEARVSTLDEEGNEISSVKKAGDIAYEYKTNKKISYQTLQHTTQEGLNTNVDNVMSTTNHSVQRGEIDVPYFPIYKRGATYFVVRSGEKIRAVNDNISFLNTGTPDEGKDMVVTKIGYEEPNGTSKIEVKELLYGIGSSQYNYPGTSYTYMPNSRDTRINTGISSGGNGSGSNSLTDVQYGYISDISFTPDPDSPTDTVVWNGDSVYFYSGYKQTINSGSFTIPDLIEPEDVFYNYYIYFDLDCDTPEVLKIIADNLGDTGGYKSVMSSKTGLLAIVNRSYQNPDYNPISSPMGNPYFAQINIFPINGKDPYIGVNSPWVDMEGLTTWDYNVSGYEYCHRYLMAVNETQIWPDDGMLRLTNESYKVGNWYNEDGVSIHSDFGIGLYAGSLNRYMALSTFYSSNLYDRWLYSMDYQSRQSSPDWSIPQRLCSSWVNSFGDFNFRRTYFYPWEFVYPSSAEHNQPVASLSGGASGNSFVIMNAQNPITGVYSDIQIVANPYPLAEASKIIVDGYLGSHLIPTIIGATSAPYTLYDLGNSTHRWNNIYARYLYGIAEHADEILVTENDSSGTFPILFSNAAGSPPVYQDVYSDNEFNYNPSTKTLDGCITSVKINTSSDEVYYIPLANSDSGCCDFYCNSDFYVDYSSGSGKLYTPGIDASDHIITAMKFQGSVGYSWIDVDKGIFSTVEAGSCNLVSGFQAQVTALQGQVAYLYLDYIYLEARVWALEHP